MTYYLRNLENNKFLYFDDETCEEVDRTSFAESMDSTRYAKKMLKLFKSQFPMLEITDSNGMII